MIRLFVGYDPREASAYHTFCDSVIRRASVPVSITALTPNMLGMPQRDGSNTFTYQRFLVPHLCAREGHAIYCDGDMICNADIAELWALRPFNDHAVACVQHNYKTRFAKKYLGNRNDDYPRKNWSSVMIFNNSHWTCAGLSPIGLEDRDGAYLHRFRWCKDSHIKALPPEWNHLVSEYDHRTDAKLYHYTIGTPCFPDYYRSDGADLWRREFQEACRPVPQFFNGAA